MFDFIIHNSFFGPIFIICGIVTVLSVLYMIFVLIFDKE